VATYHTAHNHCKWVSIVYSCRQPLQVSGCSCEDLNICTTIVLDSRYEDHEDIYEDHEDIYEDQKSTGEAYEDHEGTCVSALPRQPYPATVQATRGQTLPELASCQCTNEDDEAVVEETIAVCFHSKPRSLPKESTSGILRKDGRLAAEEEADCKEKSRVSQEGACG
jgi:hypothetical protein